MNQSLCNNDHMTKGPKGEKRPADVNELAFRIMGIATGKEDALPVSYRRKAGKKGAESRSKKLSPKTRSDIASKASKARWKSK